MIFKLDVLFYNILYVRILILYKNIVKQKEEQTIIEYYWSMGGKRASEWNRTQKIMVFGINWWIMSIRNQLFNQELDFNQSQTETKIQPILLFQDLKIYDSK